MGNVKLSENKKVTSKVTGREKEILRVLEFSFRFRRNCAILNATFNIFNTFNF